MLEPTITRHEEQPITSMFARIFVPLDYSPESNRAFRVACELRKTYGSALCIFHASESGTNDEWLGGIGSPSVLGNWVQESEERLRRFLDNVAPDLRHQVEVRACMGTPIEAIRTEMHAWKATMLIAAANVHKAIFRSAAEQLVRDIDVPTLVIPAVHEIIRR